MAVAEKWSGYQPWPHRQKNYKTPVIEDDFNENAKIAVDIKVNESGTVISAVYASRGSTSGSATLKAIAIRKALQLKFNDGDDESLGTVIFNFRLKG
jgi:hypothetical protein